MVSVGPHFLIAELTDLDALAAARSDAGLIADHIVRHQVDAEIVTEFEDVGARLAPIVTSIPRHREPTAVRIGGVPRDEATRNREFERRPHSAR